MADYRDNEFHNTSKLGNGYSYRGDHTEEEHGDDKQTRSLHVPVVVKMNAKEQRFYDRLRRQLRDKLDEYRLKLGNRTVDYLLLLPDLFVLFVRLAKDKRVPVEAKAIAGIALVYIMSPIDIVPDVFFGIGFVDDVVLAVYALKKVLVDVDQDIVLEHWTGEADLLEKVQEIVARADELVGSRVVNAIRKQLRKRK